MSKSWTVIPTNKYTLQDIKILMSNNKGGKFSLMYLDEDPLSQSLSPKQFFQIRAYKDEEFFSFLDQGISQEDLIQKLEAGTVLNVELVYYKFSPLKSILAPEWQLTLFGDMETLVQTYGTQTFEHLIADWNPENPVEVGPDTLVHYYCLRRVKPNLKDLNQIMVKELD